MERVAIYGREVREDAAVALSFLADALKKEGVETWLYEPLYTQMAYYNGNVLENIKGSFHLKEQLEGMDMLFSAGGDGTFLDAVSFVGRSQVPILGVNLGRLGFLADASCGELAGVADVLTKGQYDVEPRAVAQVEVEGIWAKELGYALNEVGVQKTEDSSLLTIRVWVNDDFLATYWADGLLVATPTGSTAYSMSCGGPIVWPTCDTLLLTPVCPHNLTMRPLVVPGNAVVRLEVESRTGEYVLTADSRSERMKTGCRVEAMLAEFKLNVVKLPWHRFCRVLREKLMWGEDVRNGNEKMWDNKIVKL